MVHININTSINIYKNIRQSGGFGSQIENNNNNEEDAFARVTVAHWQGQVKVSN